MFRAILLPFMFALMMVTLPATPAAAQDASSPPKPPALLTGDTWRARSDGLVQYAALTKPRNARSAKEAMANVAARLLLNIDTAWAIDTFHRCLDTAIAARQKKPEDPNSLNPFDFHALTNAYLLCADKFPPDAAAKLRLYASLYTSEKWTGFGSLNYRLMRDGSAYLCAELWPDMVDAKGLNGTGIAAATRARLYGYFDTIVRRNLDEYSAPIYFTTDLMAVRMLAEFARDPEMKRRATLTMDWMLINTASLWNQGYYVTSAGRSKYFSGVTTGPSNPGCTPATAYLFFGGLRPITPQSTGLMHTFWLAYPGSYQLHPIISAIATDRAQPFVDRQSVIFVPFSKRDTGPNPRLVRKYTYHAPTYSLASQFEAGFKSFTDGFFKETRRHMMKWISDKPISTFSIQQENPQRPYRIKDNIKNAFGYGENPFHQILQHRAAQVGIYDVPADYPYHRMYAPFPRTGSIVARLERDGWIFCHGGSVLFAFRGVEPGSWGKPQYDCDVMWFEQRTNGWVLDTSPVEPYAGGEPRMELARFADAILKSNRLTADLSAKPPRLTYHALSGDTLDITHLPLNTPHTNQHRINNTPVNYNTWPLMGNLWVAQQPDSPTLRIEHSGKSLTYNFDTWTRSDGAP
jgi:hypothetical protein